MILGVELLLFIFAAGILWTYLYMLIGEFKGAPWVPTSAKTQDEIWSRVKFEKGRLLMDIGSGDGRMVITAAQRFGLRGVGIELQPLLVWWSNRLVDYKKLTGVKFVKSDFWKSDLSEADYLYFYLGPKTVERLARKLEKEHKKEQIVIDKAFEIRSWKDKIIDSWETKNGSVWVYKLV